MCDHSGRVVRPFDNRSFAEKLEGVDEVKDVIVETEGILGRVRPPFNGSVDSIAIETYDLNLEEKPRKSIHDSENIVILRVDPYMCLTPIGHIRWIYNISCKACTIRIIKGISIDIIQRDGDCERLVGIRAKVENEVHIVNATRVQRAARLHLLWPECETVYIDKFLNIRGGVILVRLNNTEVAGVSWIKAVVAIHL